MATVLPELADVAGGEVQDPGKTKLKDRAPEIVNKVCFFTLSDFVEDRVRVRFLNIVAFSLIYIYFVLALLKTIPRPEPQVKLVRFASPPPSSWLSGEIGDDLKSFYSGLGSIANRSQKVFVLDDSGSPMNNVEVEVRVTDFVADGPLPCSKVQMDAMANTVEARRLAKVCQYDVGTNNKGKTDQIGLISLNNFTVSGPAGLYILRPSAGGVDSPQDAVMLVSTPVASIEVVNDSSPELEEVPAPRVTKVGEPLAWQPRILVRDMRGLPVPGRKIIAFANPDPTWPIMGPSARTPDYNRRGQKVVELNCPESELSDDSGIAKFTCLGVNGTNVDHLNFVFADSSLVFYPWNDDVYSPRSNYPLVLQSYRYSTYILPRVKKVQVTTPLPNLVIEGDPFNPQPALTVTGLDGAPVAGVACYAMASIEMGGRNPNWFRRQVAGVKNKDLLDAVAITDSNGIAQFQRLRWSVEGNTMDLTLLKYWGVQSSVFSVSFNCDGVDQDTHAWNPSSGSYIQHVEPVVAEIRIKRFIRYSAEVSRYLGPAKSDGTDTFIAVIRVVDAKGNGIPGKTVDVTSAPYGPFYAGNVATELHLDSMEQTNDLGFAVVNFQVLTGPSTLEWTGSFNFKVQFLLDGVRSPLSQWLTARMIGGIKPQVCHMIEPISAEFYSLARSAHIPVTSYPITVTSGDLFFATDRLKSATSCVTFPSISTPNVSQLVNFRCNESNSASTSASSGGEERRLQEEKTSRAHFEDIHRRLREKTLPPVERKLQSVDGSMAVQIQSVYSTVTDKWGKVRFEPSMLRVGITPIVPLPTLRQYNDQPQSISYSAIMDGPSGDHWVRVAITTTDPSGNTETCFSRLTVIRVENEIGDIDVSGDGGPGKLYEHEIEAGGYVDIDLRMVLDPAFVDATNLSLIPQCVHLANDFWALCGVTYVWMNAPYNYHQALGLTAEPLQAPLESHYHSINPVQKTSTTNAVGFDPATGTLHLRLQMTKPGIYGNFGILFSGFGVKSRVFTWRVKPPPGLRLEVIQEPKFTWTQAVPGNLLDIQPIINVTADSGPVNGLIVSFELEPETGARFQRMTNVKMFSPFPFQYSLPSGDTGPNAWGMSPGPAQDGIAYFTLMGIVDGSGCTRVRFVAEGITSQIVPTEPICLERVWNEIVTHPPPSWPLNLELQDFNGSLTVEVTPRPGFGVPQLTSFLGGFFVRLFVTSEGGIDVTDEVAFELSQRMLGDSVCLFLSSTEQLGRCSNLVLVQQLPTPILRFSFLRVNWLRRISTPGKIKLRVSDFSGSNGSQGWPLPAGFAETTPEQQFTTCASAAGLSRQLMETSMTSEISAETAATHYEITLAPPATVAVGSMFLVRVKVTTASGGPMRNARVRVGIKALKSNGPGSTSPNLLQSLALEGNSLQVVSEENVELDPITTVRVSNGDGVIGFPLTVIRGGSGTYQLQFQPDVPDANIVLQSSAFKVENTVSINASSSLGQIEVPEFGKPVTVPVSPQFCISSMNGNSLSDMQNEGIKLSMTLRLKGAPTQRESAAAQLVRDAKNAQIANAKNSANAMAVRLSQTSNVATKSAVDLVIASANRKAKGMFAGLSEEFAEACSNTPAMLLQSGDPAFAVNFGNTTATGVIGEQVASLAESLGMDPAALDPTQSLNQFTDVLMSAGSNLRPAHSMVLQGEWMLQLSDLNPTGGCDYSVNKSLQFAFKEGTRYTFSISINGVEASQDPFTVVLAPADPIDVAINWFMSFLAAILGGILLSSNVMKHHWSGLTVSLLSTLGLSVALPWMTLHQDALFGAWVWVALANFGLIYIALVWSLIAQFTTRSSTFAESRASVFEEYSRKKLVQLLGFKAPDAPKTSTFRRTFFSAFNAEDAFFFPSAFLVANLLSFLSFIYILFQSIQVLNGLEEVLQRILNTAVDRSVSFASSINNAFFQASGADLPDSATAFMYVQIQVMRDWFQKLIDSIIIGFTIGIFAAAILTLVALLGGFLHFRQSVLDARRGKFYFRKKDAKLVFATGFIGINISSSIVSYILIVGVVTVATLPFTFELTWRVIWDYLPTILVAFVLPAIISFVQMKALKKCLFGPTFIKTRAGASIFHFWQTFLALPGGVVAAIKRFVIGLVGVLAMLPITYGSNTPQIVDDVLLLDKTYRSYIAFVMLYATHNNPIMITAAQRLLHIKAARKKCEEANKHWTSSRSMLILILIRFPQLRQYRKRVLEEERKLAEMLKQQQTKKPNREISDASASAVTISMEKLEKKGAEFAEEPWIANAVADALQESVRINRRLELMKKYRSILSGLEAGTAAYDETRIKLRELCKPQAPQQTATHNGNIPDERQRTDTQPEELISA